jgi:hypothetical protein
MDKYEGLKKKFEQKLSHICQNETSLVKQTKYSITECLQTIDILKTEVSKREFKSKEDEIYFFKHLKPQVCGKLIFYLQLFNIETRKPAGNEKQLRKYFNAHLKIINDFKESNIAFYQYYRSESIYLDEIFHY